MPLVTAGFRCAYCVLPIWQRVNIVAAGGGAFLLFRGAVTRLALTRFTGHGVPEKTNQKMSSVDKKINHNKYEYIYIYNK